MGRFMNQQDREAFRKRHIEIIMDGFTNETGCMTCIESWPCDVITLLDELDRVNRLAKIYGITIKHLAERNIESEVLAVIHAYDETAESKLSRIWQILEEKA